MKLLCILLLMTLVVAGLAAAQAQQPAAPSPSLGDLARQLKAKREKALVKPQTVFTNDNLPQRPRAEGPTAAAGIAPAPPTPETKGEAPAGAAAAEQGAQAEAAPPSPGAAAEAHDEKYYRMKIKELQAQLDLHQRQLSVLQQKTSQNQMQFYADPQKTLIQENTRADVNKLTQEIDKKKMEIASDYDAVDALRDQLRREGGDPGWLR